MVMSFSPKPPHQSNPTAPHRFAELSVVALTRVIQAEEGSLPAGARGTVAAAYGDGEGYAVEFEHPFHTVVTFEAGNLTD